MRNGAFTALTMLAFASNSVLCRLALFSGAIDAASFTLIRLASGAVALTFLSLIVLKKSPLGEGSWVSGALLFVYAAAFSLAYLSLGAGMGGLILFGSVQFTMLGVGIARGERPGRWEWLGLVLALGGLVALVLPGLHAPPPLPALSVAIAGVAWGLYSLQGKRAKVPILATCDNFIRAIPFAVLALAAKMPVAHLSLTGVELAVVSGAFTSGLGYVLWYTVLPHLTATRAAISQLSVPALVAILGVLVLYEPVHPRFVIASILMLGGVATAVFQQQRRGPAQV